MPYLVRMFCNSLSDPLVHLIMISSFSDVAVCLCQHDCLSSRVVMSPSLTVLGLIYVIIFPIFGCPCVLCVFGIEISS